MGDLVYGAWISWRAYLLGVNVGRISFYEKSQNQSFNTVVASWIMETIVRGPFGSRKLGSLHSKESQRLYAPIRQTSQRL